MPSTKWRATMADFELYLSLLGFEPEVRFGGVSGKRRWRFDYAIPDKKVAVEYHVQGASHFGLKGAWRDQAKASEATVCGWRLVTCNAGSVEDGRCQAWIDHLLAETEQ